MKLLNISLRTIILLLFINSIFSLQSYALNSTIQINPNLVNGNFTWLTPNFNTVIDTCNSLQLSVNTKSDHNPISPHIYGNYLGWKQDKYVYIWKTDGSWKKIYFPYIEYLRDVNDNKLLYIDAYDEIYLYDITTESNNKIMDLPTHFTYNPHYDNNELAYIAFKNIYLKSGITTKKIDSFDLDYPLIPISLYNGKMAWAKPDENDNYQIYFWNGSTITKITSTNYNNMNPDIFDGKIAWKGYKNGHFQIFFWNGNEIIQITNTNYNNYDPKLYNGKIVWSGGDYGNREIYFWNGNTIKQLTDNNIDDAYPDIYNGRIIWTQIDSNNIANIYTCMAETPLKPSISYNSISNKTSTSIQLNGSVNPNGETTLYRFEYGLNTTYPNKTDWISIGNGYTEIQVNSHITNLMPNTTYHYRLVAKNQNGISGGSDQTFKTLPSNTVLPTVTTDNVTGIEPYTLYATINPNGFDTTFYFEYGTNTNYGNNTPISGAGSGNTNVIVTTQLSDLQPNTTYHYRIVAQNAAGTVEGEDKTFTTPAEAKISIPTGRHTYIYSSVEEPILNIDPDSAKPFAVGNIYNKILNLKIGFKTFKNPVDIYLAISYSGLPGDIFLIDSSGELHKNTIVPWKTNQTNAINESLYGNINTNDLPGGTYTLYTLVVPANATNMDNSYLWITSFEITHHIHLTPHL